MTGQSISFQNHSKNVSYQWYFGDGATSTVANPSHVYSSDGIYPVSLVINGDTAHSIKKQLKISADPMYTHLIGGTRLWQKIRTQASSGGWDTTIYYSDVSFAVNYIDPLTVSIDGKNYGYFKTLYPDTVLVFSRTDTTGVTPSRTSNIYFVPSKDSIHFEDCVGVSVGWHEYLHYYTK